MSELTVFASIAAAIVLWAIVEVRDRGRAMWSAGALLAAIHAGAAFHVFHGWSHAAAWSATARQTAHVTGLEWGGGLLLNYAFLLVWVGHAATWWLRGTTALGGTRLDLLIRGFLFFMFFNGAVVFADGVMRALGGAAIGAVALVWVMRGVKRAGRVS